MPRYLIVRTFEIDDEAMPDVGRRSKEIAKEEFPEITWEHSHVIVRDKRLVQAVLCLPSARPGDAQESWQAARGAPHRRYLGDRRRCDAGRLPSRSLVSGLAKPSRPRRGAASTSPNDPQRN
jgi:hypothetical protein